MMVGGFSLKSSSLVLQTLYNKPMLVAVDRHLQRAFKNLEWVDDKSSSDIETSIHVSQWLPEAEFININRKGAFMTWSLSRKELAL